MQPFAILEGIAASLPGANIDTDVIMPKQFLKGVDRSRLADGVFHGLRFGRAAGETAIRGGRRTFSSSDRTSAAARAASTRCGASASSASARSSARALPASSTIAARNGMLAITVEPAVAGTLLSLAAAPDRAMMAIDLPGQTITAADGSRLPFDIDADRKQALVLGLDPIGTTLQDRALIQDFERQHLRKNPWLV